MITMFHLQIYMLGNINEYYYTYVVFLMYMIGTINDPHTL